MAEPHLSTSTRAAVLGQLALREWGAYDLTRSMRRSVRWFWPRAESVIYAEAKRLVAEGLASARREPMGDGSRRQRTVYTITRKGHDQLKRWLRSEPRTLVAHNEVLLRLHLARFGSREDLLASIACAEGIAVQLLEDADAVALEFVEGRHLFQDEAHLRGVLFDALSTQGLGLQRWARDARAEVERWEGIDADDQARSRAVARMAAYLQERRLP